MKETPREGNVLGGREECGKYAQELEVDKKVGLTGVMEGRKRETGTFAQN